MYNILIVDDEYYICEGLHRKICQLHHPSVGEIRTALSGEAALKLCKTYKPQIVFTDIKMGGINGIELIHSLSQKLHPVQFIVLSGYDDFTYVRGAFQNGAIDYLLKPILNEDLSNVLSAAFSNLKRYPNTANNFREALFQLSENVFQEIASLSPDTALSSPLVSCLSNVGIEHSCCFALLVPQSAKSYDAMITQINDIYDHFDRLLCNTLSESRIGILCDAMHYSTLKDFLSDFVHTQTERGVPWAASLTESAPVSSLAYLCSKADLLTCLRLLKGYGNLFLENEIQKAQGFSPRLKHLMSQFIETPSLIKNNGLRLTFYKEIRKLTLTDLHNFFYYFNEILGIAHFDNQISISKYNPPSISGFSTFSDLENYFYTNLTVYTEKFSSLAHPISSMDIIRNYIDLHYMEDLTLTSLADHFFMSYSYLSKSFHKAFHMPFQEYLRMLRMEHALELLKNPELTIQEIASRVGYENAFNFSRSFKAEYGISPSHFRNKKS